VIPDAGCRIPVELLKNSLEFQHPVTRIQHLFESGITASKLDINV
jgi:hypothetical protein